MESHSKFHILTMYFHIFINHIYIIFQSTNQAWMVSKTSGVFSSCSLDVDPAKAVDEKRGVNGTNSQRD
jgi:hypothetical protein